MTVYNRQSILLIGATGGSGSEILNKLLSHPSKPKVHVFCRTPSKLSSKQTKLSASIHRGDARNATDIRRALLKTRADLVIISVGNGESVAKSNIRTANAEAVVKAMQSPGLEHVRAIVLSSIGAGTSSIIVGMGLGKFFEHHLRHVLKDHDGQEAAFLDSGLSQRTIIVRPTSLTDGRASGKVVEFGDNDKCPTLKTDRGDVAMYICEAACESSFDGRIVNISSKK